MQKRKLLRTAIIVAIVILLGGGLLVIRAMYGSKPRMLSFFIRVFGVVGKQRVLHGIGHRKTAESLRIFARQNRWELPPSEKPMTFFSSDSTAFPEQLRRLKASSVRIYDDRVELEFGGTPLHYGLVVFRSEDAGHGLKRLGEGIWFYSEDESSR